MSEKLYVWGKILVRDKKAVAVVGSRKMSPRGERLCRKFCKAMAIKGITIVSGLARGIDSTAHKEALKNKGRTIAVLGSGIDVIYPPENKSLAEEISKHGAVVSQFPPGTKPFAKNFLERNRIIAGLSKAVLVIEGARRSGTLSTASWAANQGVDVIAIPGSEATDWLIGQGAIVAKTPSDVIDLLR